jgi:hypothetical protein
MPDSMAKMLQMLSILSDMQSRREQIRLSQEQFAEQKRQFAVRQGVDERSEKFRMLGNLMDKSSNAGSAGQKEALAELAQNLFPNEPDAVAAFTKYGENAPVSLEMLRTNAANRGMRQGAAPIDQEAYTGAVTGGGQGQMATSQLQSSLIGNLLGQMAQTPGMATQMAQGYGQRFATGQTPLQAAQDQTIMSDPAAVTQSAGIASGMLPSAAQAGQLELGWKQLAAQLNSAKATGGLTNEQRIQGMTALSNIIEALGAKQRSESDRLNLAAIANSLSQALGMPKTPYPDEQSATGGRGFFGGLFGGSVSSPTTPNFMYPPPTFGGQSPFPPTGPSGAGRMF